MASPADPVRRHTTSTVLRRIDERTRQALQAAARADESHVAQRLAALDREWDTDRVLETEASAMGLLGLALGAFVNRPLLVLPALVAASVLVHALTGRSPLMPLLRRLGVRTGREIARERHALKALRGDFRDLAPAHRPSAAGAFHAPPSAAPATAHAPAGTARASADTPPRPLLHCSTAPLTH